MSLALLMSFQAAAAPTPAAGDIAPIDFDLRHYRTAEPSDLIGACPRGEDAAIVVCGRRRAEPYSLDKMARIYEPRPLRAEIGLGNGATANVHVEEVRFPDGNVSKRIMFGIKLPF